jgi:hypothetical protein
MESRRMVQRILVIGMFVVVSSVLAQAENVIVIPGRADVPVIINYHDARWQVVEGEEGLNRPGHVPPNVIGGRFVGPLRGLPQRTRYYPSSGSKPEVGRLEREPQTPSPASAESFQRSWSSSPSPTLPAAAPPEDAVPPADLPNPNPIPLGVPGAGAPIIIAPQITPKGKH